MKNSVNKKLLKALIAAQEALETAADKLHFDEGECVTFLESREIEDLYMDILSPMVQIEAAICAAKGVSQKPVSRTKKGIK